jgi:hypothetical protein
MPPADEPRRAAGRDAVLRPKKIEGVVVSVDCGDQLARTLPANAPHFDHLVVVTAAHDEHSQQVARDCRVDLVVGDSHHADSAFNKGHLLNLGMQWLEPDDWILLHDADCFLPPTLGDELRKLILNPGCLYYTKRHHLPADVTEPDWALVTDYELLDPHGNNNPWGYFQLFNVRASSIRRPFRFPECFCSAGTIDHWTQAQWPKDKQISLADWAGDHRFDVLHLWHGNLAARWNGPAPPNGGWRYAGQTNLGQSEEYWAGLWPAPCRVRRTNAVTCEQEEVFWLGKHAPAWGKPAEPGAVYEYSVKTTGPDEFLASPVAYRPTYSWQRPWIDAGHAALADADYGEATDGPDYQDLFPGDEPRWPGHLRQEVVGWLCRGDVLKLYEMAYYSDGSIPNIGASHGLSAAVSNGAAISVAAAVIRRGLPLQRKLQSVTLSNPAASLLRLMASVLPKLLLSIDFRA